MAPAPQTSALSDALGGTTPINSSKGERTERDAAKEGAGAVEDVDTEGGEVKGSEKVVSAGARAEEGVVGEGGKYTF